MNTSNFTSPCNHFFYKKNPLHSKRIDSKSNERFKFCHPNFLSSLIRSIIQCSFFSEIFCKELLYQSILVTLYGECLVCTNIYYSFNVFESNKGLVTQLLGVRSTTNLEKYLGLVGCNKKVAFQIVKDLTHDRLNSWSLFVLSQGKKEVFIKSVLQAIPTYAMLLLVA